MKHGGHERVIDKSECYLVANKSCTFREEGKWIYLKVRGGEEKYPRPDNLVTLGKDKFEKGENICCAYNTMSPIHKLNDLLSLMRAKGNVGHRYFEKDNKMLSDCYAYEDGIIKYTEDDYGNIVVKIGEREYEYNPLCMYYFPDGAQVRKYDRICSGVINMDHVIANLGSDLNTIYLIFRKQIYTLIDGGYLKEGITQLDSIPEDMIEMLFTGLTKINYNPKTEKIDEIKYQGTQSAILDKKSFYTVLSYGYSSKIVDKAIKKEVNLSNDVMSDAILGLLINNKLDD